jgi:hypothetical protein
MAARTRASVCSATEFGIALIALRCTDRVVFGSQRSFAISANRSVGCFGVIIGVRQRFRSRTHRDMARPTHRRQPLCGRNCVEENLKKVNRDLRDD